MEPKLFTLENGLRVCFIDTKSFSTITSILLVGAGSRYENEKNNGIAHFFEHMAFKGSKKYPSTQVIASMIEGLGGIFNAFTSKDHTGYWIKATSDHFDIVIDVLSDIIISSLLSEEEINREKDVIAEEINMYEDTPRWKSGDLFEELLYKDTSLGFDIAGKKETVKSFNKSTFVNYMNQLYYPNNAVLIIAGGFNGGQDRYLNTIKEKFGKWRKGEISGSFQPVKEKQREPDMLIKYKKTEQTHFCLGFRAYNMRDQKKYGLAVLSAILGGGMSSRLFSQVRERRGLCYYISTGRTSYVDVGNLVTSAGLTNDLDKIKEAIKVSLDEHIKVANGDVKEDELIKAKELIKGRTLLSMEDSQNVALFFGNELILLDKLTTPQEMLQKIKDVTAEEVVSIAKDIFMPNKLNLSLIGPFNEGDIKSTDLSI